MYLLGISFYKSFGYFLEASKSPAATQPWGNRIHTVVEYVERKFRAHYVLGHNISADKTQQVSRVASS
jgi:hypothetical protein